MADHRCLWPTLIIVVHDTIIDTWQIGNLVMVDKLCGFEDQIFGLKLQKFSVI